MEFTLGLQANQFLNTLGISSGKLLSLASVAQGVEKVFNGVWAAIERGGGLQDLSNRTGANTGALYQLQEAFKNVGVNADSVGPMILKMQRALSGVDETGQKTDKLFTALGLNLDTLRGQDAVAQFEALAGAMGKLDANQSAEVGAKIFGREGTGNIKQIAGDFEAFKSTIAGSAKEAAVFQRTAAAFDKIGDTIGEIKRKLGGLFAGIAEGAAPLIQAFIDFGAIDFTAIGVKIGTVISAITQAFREGTFSQLLADAFTTGFDIVVALAPGYFAKLGSFLIDAFTPALVFLQAGLEYAIDQAINNPKVRRLINTLPGGSVALLASDAAGLTSGKTSSFADIFASRKAEGFKFDFGFGEYGADEIRQTADDLLASGNAKASKAIEALFAKITDLASRAPGLEQSAKKKAATIDLEGALKKDRSGKIEGTSLEKIGFVFNGGRSGNDFARATENNTRRAAELLGKHTSLLSTIATKSFGDYANIA